MLRFMAMLFAIASLSACASSSGSTMHTLDGSVLILKSSNFLQSGSSCQGVGELFDLIAGSPVKITPKGKDAVFTKLSMGTITPEGNCRLKFTPSIPEADSYVFEIGGRLPIERARDLIDGNSVRSDWWVTFDWDF